MTTACSASEDVVKGTNCEDDGIIMMMINSLIIRRRSRSILPWRWWHMMMIISFITRRRSQSILPWWWWHMIMMMIISFIIRRRSQSILPWWWRRVAGGCVRQRRSGSGQRLDCCHWCPAEWCLLWPCTGRRCSPVHLWRSTPLCWPWSTIESITIKMCFSASQN